MFNQLIIILMLGYVSFKYTLDYLFVIILFMCIGRMFMPRVRIDYLLYML